MCVCESTAVSNTPVYLQKYKFVIETGSSNVFMLYKTRCCGIFHIKNMSKFTKYRSTVFEGFVGRMVDRYNVAYDTGN